MQHEKAPEKLVKKIQPMMKNAPGCMGRVTTAIGEAKTGELVPGLLDLDMHKAVGEAVARASLPGGSEITDQSRESGPVIGT